MLVTFSQRAGHSISEGRPDGERPYVVLESAARWNLGLALLCVGFAFQLVPYLLVLFK